MPCSRAMVHVTWVESRPAPFEYSRMDRVDVAGGLVAE